MGRYSKSGGALRHSTGLQKIQYMQRYLELKQLIQESNEIAQEEKAELKAAQLARTKIVCNQIAWLIDDDEEYHQWWKSTPDEDAGFLSAAELKLKELQEKEVQDDTTV